MYRVLICCILSQNRNLPHLLMCSLLFSQRISRALSVYICLVFLVACPSNTICFSFLSLLSPQCTEPGMLCSSFPSVYWTLLNVPRQKVEATHLSSLFCWRSQSCVYCCPYFGYICFTYFVKFFIHSKRVILVPELA